MNVSDTCAKLVKELLELLRLELAPSQREPQRSVTLEEITQFSLPGSPVAIECETTYLYYDTEGFTLDT
jgi:hypothetical protein